MSVLITKLVNFTHYHALACSISLTIFPWSCHTFCPTDDPSQELVMFISCLFRISSSFYWFQFKTDHWLVSIFEGGISTFLKSHSFVQFVSLFQSCNIYNILLYLNSATNMKWIPGKLLQLHPLPLYAVITALQNKE